MRPPPSLLRCAPAPTPPGAGSDQQATALYMLELAAAHADCRSRLARLRALYAAAEPD